MLFYTNKDGKVILHPDVYKLVPDFRKLDEDQMLYIILSTDDFALFHQYPPDQRKQKSRRWVYGNDSVNPEADPKVRKAIEEYNRLQYNEKKHSINVLLRKKTNLELLFQSEENPDKMNKYLDALQNIQKVIDKYKNELVSDLQTQAILKGNREKSLLEIMQSNGRLYDLRKEALQKTRAIEIENNLSYDEGEAFAG